MNHAYAAPLIGSIRIAAGAAALLLLAGCASPGPRPSAELASAQASIAQAESVGALTQAPVDLLAAREKFAQAESAARDERYLQARLLAERAQADAEVAERRSRAVKAQAAVTELARSNEALRSEMQRKAP